MVHNAFGLACGHYCCARCLQQVACLPPGGDLRHALAARRCPQCRQPGVFSDAMPLPQLDTLENTFHLECTYSQLDLALLDPLGLREWIMDCPKYDRVDCVPMLIGAIMLRSKDDNTSMSFRCLSPAKG